MADVMVTAWSNGDGWLSVDTAEWIAERAEHCEKLTDDLREWMENRDFKHPTTDVLVLWVKDRTGEDPVGLYGDGLFWAHNTCNIENILSDDLGFVVFSAGGELGDLMVTMSGDGGLYSQPEVYRDTTTDTVYWGDYAHAFGRCVNDHEWETYDGHRLQRYDGGLSDASPTISGQARVPFGDHQRAYVACPECRKSLRFTA
ncbi:hypothetical protein ACIRG5_38755 [Lentzea sp. NPDC102401]|uniref:hypothetical protein n=1 Tax=Lentzea sp. NPDC102401 TaxID=3364128 RepID=UPI00381B3A55